MGLVDAVCQYSSVLVNVKEGKRKKEKKGIRAPVCASNACIRARVHAGITLSSYTGTRFLFLFLKAVAYFNYQEYCSTSLATLATVCNALLLSHLCADKSSFPLYVQDLHTKVQLFLLILIILFLDYDNISSYEELH